MTNSSTSQQPGPEMTRFFTQLYPDTQDGWLILSYPDPTRVNPTTGKRPLLSMWLDLAKLSMADVARHAVQLSAQDTVYFGVVLQRPDCTPHVHHRSTNAGAYHVPGLWFDLDLATGAHAASTLPATEAEGLAFLHGFQAVPSLIVRTGGGLHAYWLFKEMLTITSPAEHDGVTRLCKQFHYTLALAGQVSGWTFDSTGDLARVLRPAGTINYKYGTRVEVLHEDAIRYNPSDFDWLEALPEPAWATHGGAAVAGQPDLVAIAEHYGAAFERKSEAELAAAHPQHGSSTGDNFNVNVAKGLWHCWRHTTGGDALSLIAVCAGLIPCEEMRAGALKGKNFTRVVDIANATFKAGIVLDAARRRNGSTPGPAFDLAAFLDVLQTTAPADRLSAVLAAIDGLATLPLADWVALKPTLKTQVPALNLNDLEKLRTQAQAHAQQQAHTNAQAKKPAWEQALFTKKNGELEETDNNLQAIFANHPICQGRLWWDVVAGRAYFDDRQVLDIHYVRNEVVPWLGATLRMPIRHSSRVLEVMRSWAQRQPRDPIQEWLATLPEQDTTDLGRELLETWMVHHAGAEDTPYARFVSRILIVSLVQRAMSPGIQYRYVVVLEGEENVGKTQLLRRLGDRWHMEFPKSVEGKESYMQLQGYWLVELGELDALKPAQESRIKMFISQQMDVWIPKYENDATERPRRAVLVGTTNEREYLKGDHGNTRYLPLWLHGPIDLDAIAAVRDRLFTQAKHFLADHPQDWWCIPDDVEEELKQARKARQEPGIFDDKLAPFFVGRTRATVAEALEYLLIPTAQWDKPLEMAVGKAFKAHGWYRHLTWDVHAQKMHRFWANTPQKKQQVPF